MPYCSQGRVQSLDSAVRDRALFSWFGVAKVVPAFCGYIGYEVGMPKRGGSVHVATIKTKYVGDRVYVSHLLRRSYREGGRVRHENRGNLSHLPETAISAICRVLGGRDLGLGGGPLRDSALPASEKLAHTTLRYHPALGQHGNPAAHLLDLMQKVAAREDRDAALSQTADELADLLHAGRHLVLCRPRQDLPLDLSIGSLLIRGCTHIGRQGGLSPVLRGVQNLVGKRGETCRDTQDHARVR